MALHNARILAACSYDSPHFVHWPDAFGPAGDAWRAGWWARSRPRGEPDPFPMPTLGGKQFWADELFFHQWRIQRNVFTGHCRLLDEHDLRHASGTLRRVPRGAGTDQAAAPPAAHERQGGRRAARAGAGRGRRWTRSAGICARRAATRSSTSSIRARRTTWPSTPDRSATSSTTSTASRRSTSSATAWATS